MQLEYVKSTAISSVAEPLRKTARGQLRHYLASVEAEFTAIFSAVELVAYCSICGYANGIFRWYAIEDGCFSSSSYASLSELAGPRKERTVVA